MVVVTVHRDTVGQYKVVIASDIVRVQRTHMIKADHLFHVTDICYDCLVWVGLVLLITAAVGEVSSVI